MPGFVEIDLVGHEGGNPSGDFCQTMSVTDIATTWTEPRAVRNKAQKWVFAALNEIVAAFPFVVVGIDFGQRQRVHQRPAAAVLQRQQDHLHHISYPVLKLVSDAESTLGLGSVDAMAAAGVSYFAHAQRCWALAATPLRPWTAIVEAWRRSRSNLHIVEIPTLDGEVIRRATIRVAPR
jgi:hypothetical protein